MRAAEGEVQEKGYTASFPSLINVSGQATYIMVLKDVGGLVKLYALVNVEQYSVVATGTTQAEAMAAYKALLKQSGIVNDVEPPSAEVLSAMFTVSEIKTYTVEGNTVMYFVSEDGIYYKGMIGEIEELIFVSEGDALCVEYSETDNEKIRLIKKLEPVVKE